MTIAIIVGLAFFLVMDIAVAVSMARTGRTDEPEELDEPEEEE